MLGRTGFETPSGEDQKLSSLFSSPGIRFKCQHDLREICGKDQAIVSHVFLHIFLPGGCM